MEISINLNGISSCDESLGYIASKANNLNHQIQNIKAQMSNVGSSSTTAQLKRSLNAISDNLSEIQGDVVNLQQVLITVQRLYLDAENRICARNTNEAHRFNSENTIITGPIVNSADDSNILTEFLNEYSNNFWLDALTFVLQGTSNGIIRFSGLINIWNALAANSGTNGFYILDPNILSYTNMINRFGTMLLTGARYGLPILGVVIDLNNMINREGEELHHSLIKASGHLLINIGSGKAGAAIGGLIGSVIPGVGTVAGTVIGGGIGVVIGVAISSVSNLSFNYVYDTYVADVVDSAGEFIGNTVDSVGEFVSDTAEAVGDFTEDLIDGVGDAFVGFSNRLGSIFG